MVYLITKQKRIFSFIHWICIPCKLNFGKQNILKMQKVYVRFNSNHLIINEFLAHKIVLWILLIVYKINE